jgi:hypothetical protein
MRNMVRRFLPRPLHVVTLVLVSVFVVGDGPAARAGGGPENVLLVVNRQSADSLTIANHYAELRRIPPGNVLTLPWDPARQEIDVDTFREMILVPILEAIDKRQLSAQIDYVVYSADFPWRIGLQKDVDRYLEEMRRAKPQGDGDGPAELPAWPKHLPPQGSLNGLTYFWQPVAARSAAAMDLRGNAYMRLSPPGEPFPTSLGFRSQYQFDQAGQLIGAPGRRYLLSTVLGITYGRGNTVEEILAYLRRAAEADGTFPKGTIYFVQNQNIRSKARHDAFPDAVRALKDLGVAAEILTGSMPMKKDDVQGVVMGVAGFDWNASGSTILPGAICDHFTSFGGIMSPGAGQTPLSEFLRHGAAGASGTVVEPFAIPAKFPSPMIQVHYARGCSLAEAFYQSVWGPYQLLIVGDPLCQPWANVPRVSVEGVEPGATVRGKLVLRPAAEFPRPSSVEHFELFIDGLRRGGCRPGETLEIDTAELADGYHELRVVAIESGPIQTQGRTIIPITTSNHGRTVEASIEPAATVASGKPLVVSAHSPDAIGIVVLHNSHLVGRMNGPSGRVEIDTKSLGLGPVRLRVVSLGDGKAANYAWAQPLEVEIVE